MELDNFEVVGSLRLGKLFCKKLFPLRKACRRKGELYRHALDRRRRPTSRSDRHNLRAPAHGRLTDNIISEAAPFVKTRKTKESLSSSQTAGDISPPDSDQKRALCTWLHAGSLCSDILFGCRQNSRPKKLQICAYFAIISLGKRSGRTAERSNGIVTSCTHLSCIHQPRAARLSLRLGLARHPPRSSP